MKNFNASSSGPYQAQVGNPYANRFNRSGDNSQFEQAIMRPQSPAMAQRRRSSRPYDARTGRSLSDNELNNFYRSEAEAYRRAGGSLMGGGVLSQNPYLMSLSDRSSFNASSKNQTAIDDAQKPKFGASNWNY